VTPPLLLLWDIDGTLLHGATEDHRDALHSALREVYRIEPAGVAVDPAGRTDFEIARQILLGRDVDAATIDAGLHAFQIACAEAYAGAGNTSLAEFVLPGVPDALDRFAERDDVILALLTGNIETIARMKLRRAGIEHYFAHHQGAFGSDSEDRTDLPAIARHRAGGDAGHPHPRERTVVIGDTPRDVACAQADEVRCVGVATGRFKAEDLGAADVVVRNAREAAGVLEGWV
jgi:phosphoglycolate phosphatase